MRDDHGEEIVIPCQFNFNFAVHIVGYLLKGVVEQDGEYHANGHTGQGFKHEFDNGFGVHGMEIMETFAPGFKRWIAAST